MRRVQSAIKTVSGRKNLSVEEAAEAIDSGKATEMLNKLVEYSNQ